MMKTKPIIIISILLLLAVVGLMVWDFYYESAPSGNPYEYRLSDLKKIDPSEFCYIKSGEIKPDMTAPYSIAINEADEVFVAGSDQVMVFDQHGGLINSFGISEKSRAIAVSADGRIFLGMKDHVEVFDVNGSTIARWAKINDKAQLTSIAVEDESVFVADAGNRIVYHFDLSGQLVNTIGEKDKEAGFGGFILPSAHFDLAIGREGQLWIVNPGKHEFLAFNKQGVLFSSWSRTSMQLDGFSGCCNPGNIALRSDGSFVTSEKGIERVKIHYPSGDYKCVVAGPDSFAEGTEHIDLAVNSFDRIYVLDTGTGVIGFFDEK
jgi:hypothetical protein